MKISVRIPATSANLGPGFDCMGVALDLWNCFELQTETATHSLTVKTEGEGAEEFPHDRSHLVARIMVTELAKLTGDATWYDQPPAFALRCHNQVPSGSGLGSSSTAVLGGLMLAHAYAHHALGHGDKVDLEGLLQRAIEHEGHGDNVAPALLGGLVIVSSVEGPPLVQRISIPTWRVVVCVPTFHFLTSTARSVLPIEFSKHDAIHNIGRAILMSEALRNGDAKLLSQAISDRMHVPYRLPRIPGASEARRAALDQGAFAVTLSGAGPGLIAFTHERHEQIGEAMVEAFGDAKLPARFWVLDTIDQGAEYTITE